MYTEFFGLKTKPFSITPDPKFLYMSPYHKEALAHLIYGIREHTGFVVITGEVGTGKTTILNAMLLRLSESLPRVVIKNPSITPGTIYFLLGKAIGIPEEKRSINYLHEYESRLNDTGGALIIVDEAQGLPVDLLEEIRLLSNLETPDKKLVQIILLGQQELNNTLMSPRLRQLKQRIAIKYHIPPLNSKETADYIEHRLEVAGYEPREKPIFTKSAIEEIYKQAKGFPRLINIICDNAMLSGYADDTRQIGAKLIRKVVHDMGSTYGKGTNLDNQPYKIKDKHRFDWRMVLIAVVSLCIGASLAWYGMFSPAGIRRLATEIKGYTTPMSKATTAARQEKKLTHKTVKQLTKPPQQSDKTTPAIPPPLPEPHRPKGIWVTVKLGDTIADIAAEYYGRVNNEILRDIQTSNPQIKNMDIIYEGNKVFLPNIEPSNSVIYSVSVASYHSMEEARAVFHDLLTAGFDATLYPYIASDGRTWYRITIGSFETKNKAVIFSTTLKDKGFLYAKPVKIIMEE